MLDTVKFKIKINDEQYENIRKNSIETVRRDNSSGNILFRFLTSELDISSYNRHINIFLKEDELSKFCVIEFSLPKFKFGHNIYMIYPNEIEFYLNKLRGMLIEKYLMFPPIEDWEIERIDICYNWKLETQEKAQQVLDILKTFDLPRRQKTLYPTSIYLPGETYTLKYYLKYNEFYAHDYKHIKKIDYERAINLYNIACGVFRMEVSLKKRLVNELFGKKPKYTDLTYDKILQLAQKYHYQFLGLSNSDFMKADKVLEVLEQKYGHVRGMNLWQFYCLVYSDNTNLKQILYRHYDRTTIWQYKKALKEAKVGLPHEAISFNFSLELPSEYSTNDITDPPAGGSSQENLL